MPTSMTNNNYFPTAYRLYYGIFETRDLGGWNDVVTALLQSSCNGSHNSKPCVPSVGILITFFRSPSIGKWLLLPPSALCFSRLVSKLKLC